MEENKKKMKIIGKVPRVDGRELSYRRFWEQFMQANKPVLLTGLMDSWAACRDWVLLDGKPNLSFIAEHFGSSLVQVPACFSFSPFLPLSHRFPSQSESSKLLFFWMCLLRRSDCLWIRIFLFFFLGFRVWGKFFSLKLKALEIPSLWISSSLKIFCCNAVGGHLVSPLRNCFSSCTCQCFQKLGKPKASMSVCVFASLQQTKHYFLFCVYTKHPSHESAFQSTRKQYCRCLYVLEAGIKAIHECNFAVYKKAVLLLLVSFAGRYQKHPGQCVLQSTRKQYVLHDWLW